MNSQEIGFEVQAEINRIIQTYGVDKLEFGIGDLVSNVKPVAKTTFWFNLNRSDNKILYAGCCDKFVLLFNENQREYMFT